MAQKKAARKKAVGAGASAEEKAVEKTANKTAKKTTRKKKTAEPASRGPTPAEVSASPPPELNALAETVAADGGAVLGTYRDPLGGKWQMLVALPVDKVEPTPFQRDLSAAHAERLRKVIDKLDRFLDPVIVVRKDDGTYWTPNGHHRTAAMRALGARSIVALLVPEAEMAYEILALNTEKAHNLRERALEVIRMARDLATLDPAPESDYAAIFEEPSLLTLGACYERKGRFAGSAYHSVLKRVEAFQDAKLPEALVVRDARADTLLALDEAVNRAVAALKERGLDSPYLKNFVVARVNPLRFARGEAADFEGTFEKMLAKAESFDAGKVKADQVSRAGGAPEE